MRLFVRKTRLYVQQSLKILQHRLGDRFNMHCALLYYTDQCRIGMGFITFYIETTPTPLEPSGSAAAVWRCCYCHCGSDEFRLLFKHTERSSFISLYIRAARFHVLNRNHTDGKSSSSTLARKRVYVQRRANSVRHFSSPLDAHINTQNRITLCGRYSECKSERALPRLFCTALPALYAVPRRYRVL